MKNSALALGTGRIAGGAQRADTKRDRFLFEAPVGAAGLVGVELEESSVGIPRRDERVHATDRFELIGHRRRSRLLMGFICKQRMMSGVVRTHGPSGFGART
ncbi:MAG TPA: hypothetical protein VN894_15590, partial [Polyangiaceae bacterium]|nr:hypothetical protein [Polyangiaceae bacterium]